MTTLRYKYQTIANYVSFVKITSSIDKWKIDVNKQDEKGRTLLFYMIDASGCEAFLTLEFIKEYKPHMGVYDNHGQTVFFRLRKTVDEPDFYYRDDVEQLIKFMLNMTPELVLLKKDNKNRSAIEFLSGFVLEYFTGYQYDYQELKKRQITSYRLSPIITQINIHINKRCSFFNIMYSNLEKQLKNNKK